MRKFLVVFILLVSFWLVGCKAAAPASTSIPTPMPNSPTAVPASPTVEAVDYCVSCHTDKEQLISTAKLVEAVESESKGVG